MPISFFLMSVISVKKFARENTEIKLFTFNYNRSLTKFQTNLHVAFLRQQPGDNHVIFPETWPDIENIPMPVSEEMNWHKWEAKAKELYPIGKTVPAVFAYESSIKALRTELQVTSASDIFGENQVTMRKHWARLASIVSGIYSDYGDEIAQGTRFNHVSLPCTLKTVC